MSTRIVKFNKDFSEEQSEWVAIGKILKVIGLKGWVRVSIMTDFPNRFKEGAQFHIQTQTGSPVTCTIADVRKHYNENILELKFVGFDDRNAVLPFTGAYLVIPKSERKPTDDSSFYPDEIQGMELISPSGEKVGMVLKLEVDAPCPYLVIDSRQYGEVLIPFRKVFFAEISKKKARLRLSQDLSVHVPID